MRPFLRCIQLQAQRIDLAVVTLTRNRARLWHQYIQPHIASDQSRLDRKWHWPRMMPWLALIELLNRREVIAYAVVLPGSQNAVPVGLALMSVGFPMLDQPSDSSVFLWYLTTAPAKALAGLGVAHKPPLLEVLLDIAMVESEAKGYGGRIGLHAANDGNSPASVALYEAYKTRCGLTALPANLSLPGVRRNDGRYFVASSAVAHSRMTALDSYR